MSKIVLIGGYPEGYDEPFHIKTTSGRILRKIVTDLNMDSIRKSFKNLFFGYYAKNFDIMSI